METRILVTKYLESGRSIITKTTEKLAITSMIIALALITSPASAKDRQRISFYKVNKDGITQSLRFVAGKARKPGCHNFISKPRLYQVVQFRYKVCQVYSKKSCNPDSIMKFYREKEPEVLSSDLSEGFAWHPVGDHERGEKAKSCTTI